MKNKLIPKHQKGNKVINWFTNATIGAAMAENPSIMTASGWKQKDGQWEQKPTKESKQLAENIATISTFSPTNPATAIGDAVISSIVPTLKGLKGYYQWKQAINGNNKMRAKILSSELDSQIPNIKSKPQSYISTSSYPRPVSDYFKYNRYLNFRDAKGIQDASQRLQNFYLSPEYRQNLIKASEYDKIFSNMFVPNTLVKNLQKGIELTPGKNRGWMGATNYNKKTKRPIISFQQRLPENEVDPTALHEVAHASLKGGDASRIWSLHIKPYLSKNIELRTPQQIIHNLGVDEKDFKTVKKLMDNEHYSTDIDEIRSRTLSLMDQAKNSKLSFDNFIDKYSYSNQPNVEFGKPGAPGELEDLLRVMTPNSIKDFSKVVIGTVPVIGALKKGSDK